MIFQCFQVYYNYNYGQYFTLWDRIGGSFRNPSSFEGYGPMDEVKKRMAKQKQQIYWNQNRTCTERKENQLTLLLLLLLTLITNYLCLKVCLHVTFLTRYSVHIPKCTELKTNICVRTTEILQRTHIFTAIYCIKVHNVPLKLALPISGYALFFMPMLNNNSVNKGMG